MRKGTGVSAKDSRPRPQVAQAFQPVRRGARRPAHTRPRLRLIGQPSQTIIPAKPHERLNADGRRTPRNSGARGLFLARFPLRCRPPAPKGSGRHRHRGRPPARCRRSFTAGADPADCRTLFQVVGATGHGPPEPGRYY